MFVGGVIEGVGERVGMARVPARIIYVVAALIFTGLMLLLYAAAWALLPDRDGNIIIQNFGRGVTNVGALIGIGVLLLLGFGSLDGPALWFPSAPWATAWLGGGEGAFVGAAIFFAVVLPLLVVGGVVWLIVYLVRRGGEPGTAASRPPVTTDSDPAAAKGPKTAATPASPAPASATTTAPKTANAAVPPPPVASAPAAPPRPPVPPKPRVPGPGRGGYLGMLAVLILAVATVAAVSRIDRLAINPGLAWFALTLIGLGFILIIVSLAGRKQGFLGFMSVPFVILGLIFAFHGDTLRDSYLSARDAIEREIRNGVVYDDSFSEDVDVEWEEVWASEIDPTAYFIDDYTQVFFTPACFEGSEQWLDPDTSVTRIALGDVTADTELEILGEHTVMTVPAGTNLVHLADGYAQSVVVWPARDIYCEFWDGDQRNFSITNPNQPTVTLTVYDDMYMNTIVINEVEQP